METVAKQCAERAPQTDAHPNIAPEWAQRTPETERLLAELEAWRAQNFTQEQRRNWRRG